MSKPKKIELDVDFIGGIGSLTIEEEKELSVYFKNRKTQESIVNPVKKKLRPKKSIKSLA